ncbi:hypothetical protein JOD29_003288 [Lysinibacillus composti]|nr:hypothetical protein [Lysinibacillus composti]
MTQINETTAIRLLERKEGKLGVLLGKLRLHL